MAFAGTVLWINPYKFNKSSSGPPAVTGITRGITRLNSIILYFTSATGAASYSIVSNPATTTQTVTNTVGTVSYRFTGLSAGTSYTFSITSVNAAGVKGGTANSPSYTTAGSSIVTTNLIGYWDFYDIHFSYPSVGTRIYDLTSNAIDMTTTGTYTTNYMTFTNSQYAASINNQTVDFTSGITIEILINPISSTQNGGALLSMASSSQINAPTSITSVSYFIYGFNYFNSTYYKHPTLRMNNNGNVLGFSISTYTYTANTWTHIVITSSTSLALSFYINNVLTPTTVAKNVLANISNSPLYIGDPNGVNSFNAEYGLVRMYNTVLTPTQVQQNYNAVKNLSGNPYGLP